MKPNSKVKTYHLSEQTCKQIEVLADESGESATAIVEQAIAYLYKRDVLPETLILARLQTIEDKVSCIETKEEAYFSLIRFIIPYFIAALPDMFHSQDETQMIVNKGMKNFEKLETMYKKGMVKNRRSFMENLFADLRIYLEKDK